MNMRASAKGKLFFCPLTLLLRASGFAAEAKPGWQATWYLGAGLQRTTYRYSTPPENPISVVDY
jgi:hypothetical protein